MLVANIKIWKSHLNIREGSDYEGTKYRGFTARSKTACESVGLPIAQGELVCEFALIA